MKALWNQHPWKTVSKFLPAALAKGYTEAQVREFFKRNVVHDKQKVKSREYFLPIYGTQPGVYQFDTLIQSRGATPGAFLIVININSRKGYAYPLANKGKDDVLRALSTFVQEAQPKPVQMTSDQDTAYLSSDVVSFMLEHSIDYRTTDDNNHNILGIINRFIKTLRDLNQERDFTTESMNKAVNTYNNTVHSSTQKTPNTFTENDEKEYVSQMKRNEDEVRKKKGFQLHKGDKVKIILDNKAFNKKRSNISKDYYIIDAVEGNGYLIKSRNESVAYMPRHKLIPASSGVFAETLDNGKRGIIDEIQAYNEKTDKYTVKYTDGSIDKIKSKNMRETRPTHLGTMEIEYWKKNKKIPSRLKRFVGSGLCLSDR